MGKKTKEKRNNLTDEDNKQVIMLRFGSMDSSKKPIRSLH